MEKKHYDLYDETVYTEVLDNGLTVNLLPKKSFEKTYALFTTDYGSIDNHFVPLGEEEAVRVPDGIAHFLEHKLFEKEDGDVFQRFSELGASANAFTSFTQTSYLFSTTMHVKENLETLLNFVQEPYFTEETVEKEKGIIAQEIQMYDDMPEWRLSFGLLENLYPNHPVSIDIAGTVDSIQDITKDHLYLCYNTFYQPSNMNLSVAGQFDPYKMMEFIKENQSKKDFSAPSRIERIIPDQENELVIPESREAASVNQMKYAIGFRGGEKRRDSLAGYKYGLAGNILLNMLFGSTSQTYLDLYDRGIIDHNFGYSMSMERSYDFISVSGEGKQSEKAIVELKEILLDAENSDELTEQQLELVKKRTIGQGLRALNSVEYIARHLYSPLLGNYTLFDLLPLINEITLEDIKNVASDYFTEENITVNRIVSESKEQ